MYNRKGRKIDTGILCQNYLPNFKSIFEQVANELGIQPTPSAFQIRFGGCKGVVAQNPMLTNGDVLWIGESMRKFKSKSDNLEILEVTRPGQTAINSNFKGKNLQIIFMFQENCNLLFYFLSI